MHNPAVATSERGVVPLSTPNGRAAISANAAERERTERTGAVRSDGKHDPSEHDGQVEHTEDVERAIGFGNGFCRHFDRSGADELKGEVIDTGVKCPRKQPEYREDAAP